jgi:DNA-binding response OmpR family regulator
MLNSLIFLVDDDADQTFLTSTVLKMEGFSNLKIYNHPKEALRAAQELRPKVVVSDVAMPLMDGYELCYILKNMRETKDCKVIMLSALGTPLFINLAKQAHADVYIKKPYTPQELIDAIKIMLRKDEHDQSG